MLGPSLPLLLLRFGATLGASIRRAPSGSKLAAVGRAVLVRFGIAAHERHTAISTGCLRAIDARRTSRQRPTISARRTREQARTASRTYNRQGRHAEPAEQRGKK